MPIPEVSREKLLEAIEKFDQELRANPEFAKWEEKLTYRYAIEHEGRQYPVKTIVSLATGVPTNTFSGGSEANGYARARGLTVVTLRAGVLKNAFETILRDYPSTRATQPFGHDNEIRKLFDACQEVLSSSEVLGDKPIRVKASIGQGNWAKVPWIAFLDPRETDTTQRGVYVVLLFRQDGSGVYATLNQGVTAPQNELGPAAGREQLRERARSVRERPETQELERLGFQTDDAIDLRADAGLGRDYEASTIAYKLYEKGAVPDDEVITDDLQALLKAYDTYLATNGSPVSSSANRAWIFQANPALFDTRGALRSLKHLTWLAKQHASELSVGDPVYLWESGAEGGVVGIAEIAEAVRGREQDEESRPFNRRSEAFQGSQPRVSLAIKRAVEPILSRDLIRAEPALRELSILRFPQSMNFSITTQERQVLDALLERIRSTSVTRTLCLIGTWRDVEGEVDRVRQAIEEKKGWADPWSFPIKRGAQPVLQKPFHVYLYVGDGRVPVRMRVTDYVTSQGSEGRLSPWPEITDSEWIGKTRGGPEQADIFKTWFEVDAIEKLNPELHISDFEPAQGLSVEGGLLSAVTFGYAHRRRENPMEALIAHTLLERHFLEEIVSTLTRPVNSGGSPQIVLAGPPGTSKTWVAEAIAQHITGDASRVRLVQFHPNYSYEAFVEGLRPVAEGGGIAFRQQHGALLSLVEDMRKAGEINPTSPVYALIVDEMNRANLPRVFGELMYLFEYRDKTIRLQYSDAFSLPPNLRFIGTMNTADRSIRSIDIALRRRFDVFELKPDAGVLGRFFEKHPLNAANLIEGFENLNQKLDGDLDRHHTIGHAFFMKPGLDRKMLRAIWDRKIYPLIEEYFFDQLDIARREYVFETFWPE